MSSYRQAGKYNLAAIRDGTPRMAKIWPPSSTVLAAISSMRVGTGGGTVPQSGQRGLRC